MAKRTNELLNFIKCILLGKINDDEMKMMMPELFHAMFIFVAIFWRSIPAHLHTFNL